MCTLLPGGPTFCLHLRDLSERNKGLMKSPNLLLPLLAAFGFAVPAIAGHFTLDTESGSVWVDRADVRIPGDTGTPFSMTDDLSADDPQAYIRLRGTWEINERHEITALWAPLSFDFAGAFDRPIAFDGTQFAEGRATTGSYRFNSYRLSYRYNFITNENLKFGLGLTAKVRDAEIALQQGSLSESDSNVGVVPLINFKLDWRIAPQWHLLVDGDALGASQGHAVDVGVGLQYMATENLGLRLGYRILDGGADNDDVYTFARFQYAMAGVTWRF